MTLTPLAAERQDVSLTEMNNAHSVPSLPYWARALFMVSRPLAIFPVAVMVAAYFGRYSPEQITGLQEVPLFLQGNTDMGGSDIFSATVAMYVVFGLLGSAYVTIRMHTLPRAPTYLAELRRSLWELRFHVLVFVVGGTACWDYDSRIGPNDFRNMFLFAILVYSVSVAVVTGIGRSRLSLAARVALAPLAIYAWLWLGWDGNTAKAGQVLASGTDPAFRPRSAKHRVMLAWHQACDRVLGDR
jgi:hypothetical protein